jgi:acyl-CoA synthetase (AMP-forming)/AMP-acid ligase II
VKNVIVGGSAAPLSMIKKFDQVHDAFLVHAWGMTEMSPLGTSNVENSLMKNMPIEERYRLQQKQGRPVFGVEMKIVDDNGQVLPHDGIAFGRLLVRGPWVINQYYKSDDMSSFENGWLDTGDVANIDANNYLGIVDRSKDVIKSGGEWISSIDLENAAVDHPDILEACVIAAAHEKWDERPLLLAILKPGSTTSGDDIKAFLKDKIAKFWMPDEVIFVDSLPHTATGKLLKIHLRKEYHDYLLNR